MGRSQETYNKKEVRNRKEKKRKEKEKKRLEKKEKNKSDSFEDMIAYVDENGQITSTPPDDSNKKDVRPEDIQISVKKQEDTRKNDSVKSGILSYFNEDKGYGFIKESEFQNNVFVHSNQFLNNITLGDRVHFETEKGPKGIIAVNVSKIEKDNS